MLCKCILVTKKRYDLLNIKIRLNDINASQSAKHFIVYKARKNDGLRFQEFQKQTVKQKCMLFCTCVCVWGGGSYYEKFLTNSNKTMMKSRFCFICERIIELSVTFP